jgi:hypothetical protein
MTSYLDFNDLKSTIIGIVGGIISFFICVAIQRYWANRSIKSLKSRIEQNEAYKAQLDNYARSDRALLIGIFQALFATIAVICGVVALQISLLFGETVLLGNLVYVLIWFLPILLCVGIIKLLQDIRDHPKSLEKIETRITKLKKRLLGQE